MSKSTVRLVVGGRDYSVACAAGEEEHIQRLGRAIDAKVQSLGSAAIGSESRMLLFAALLLADEVHETLNRDGAPPPPPPPPPDRTPELEALCVGVEAAAERLELLAQHLEQAADLA
jgi:cell division protein ZapA